MAQHIEIKNFPQKIFRNIERSIHNETEKLHHNTTNMKWEWLYRVTGREEDKNIYLTWRYIGKGFVHGDTRGTFEVHKDENGIIKHIYLVA